MAISSDPQITRVLLAKAGSEQTHGALYRRSAGKIAGERKSRLSAYLAPIDLQVFEDALDVVSRLVDRDHLDPVDHVDIAAARIAVIAHPLPHPARTCVVGSDRQRVRAPEIVDQSLDI